MQEIDVVLEMWDGTPVIGVKTTEQRSAEDFKDKPAIMHPRQAVFYRNLVRIAEVLKSRELPIEFVLTDGTRARMDHGCIKMAELAGFIEPLENGPSGYVEKIRLAWKVRPNE
jgi:hypothetical protein